MNRYILESGILVTVMLLLTAAAVPGATLYVPDDYWTIQEAVDASTSGDTIIVRPGVYAENVDLGGKSIVLTSEKGPHVTTIDGNRVGSVVTYAKGEGPGSVLRGFTITNGYDTRAAGILCSGVDALVIAGNIIRDNEAFQYHYSHGGGIYCVDSRNLVLRNNRIMNNIVRSNGGAVNDSFGGGLYLSNCSNILLCNSVIAENEVATNNSCGAGIYASGSSLKVVNSTIVANEAYGEGGGIFNRSSTIDVFNTILWNNRASAGPEIWLETATSPPSVLSIDYSDLEGGQQSVHVQPGSSLQWGPAMIDSDPLLVDSDDGDYHLLFASPCRNSGSNAAVPPVVRFDFEGDPRIHDGDIDMGADEAHLRLYHDGEILPGMTVDFKVAGNPGTAPVRLLLASATQNPPSSTPYGHLFLKGPFHWIDMGAIPPNGVLLFQRTVPLQWKPWEEKGVQALVGPLSGGAELTNLDLLIVR